MPRTFQLTTSFKPFGIAVILLTSFAFAQDVPFGAAPTGAPKAKMEMDRSSLNVPLDGGKQASPAAPISKKDMALAKKLFEQGEAEIGGYEPPSRTYLCYLLGTAQMKLDRPKARELFLKCLTTSHEIEDKTMREQLQGLVTKSLLTYGAASLEELLPQLEGQAREDLRGQLIKHYTDKKKFDHALELLSAVRPGEEEFPYTAAVELMQQLPEEMSGEKSRIFAQALSQFKQSPPAKNMFMRDDLAMMVVRFAAELPPQTVMEAADAVLANAKEADQKLSITMAADAKSATFTSLYDYRLFELLPAIRAIDPDRAKNLLSDDQKISGSVDAFPQGMRSLNPSLGEKPAPESDRGHMSMTVRMGDGPQNSGGAEAMQQLSDLRQRQANEAVKLAAENPRQAIAAAASLASTDEDSRRIKCDAFMAIARELQTKEPGFAVQAVQEMLKNTSGLSYQMENIMLNNATGLLLKMGENDAAMKVIKRGMELAETVYDKDRESGDPNLAIHPYWPSAAIWKTFISRAAKISPQMAMDEIKEIHDPEIQTFAKVSFANTLLANKGGMMIMQEKRKSGKDMMMMFGDDDK